MPSTASMWAGYMLWQARCEQVSAEQQAVQDEQQLKDAEGTNLPHLLIIIVF